MRSTEGHDGTCDHLLATSDYFDDWEPSVKQGARLAEEYSGTLPIEGNEDSFNNLADGALNGWCSRMKALRPTAITR
jgi:hypothetical protein